MIQGIIYYVVSPINKKYYGKYYSKETRSLIGSYKKKNKI